jgi:glycosyltransferase involved in cell wall biosynthesis
VQAFTLLTTLHRQQDIQVAAVVMNEGELATRLRQNGIPVHVLPETSLSAFQIARQLRDLIATWRPDVIHTHRIKENILGCLANALSGNVPSVRTVHGAGEHRAKGLLKAHKRLLSSLDRWCGRHLQRKIIAVSSELADLLAQDYPRDHVVVIENGIDIASVRSRIHAVEWSTAEPGATQIGIVGRLMPVKRVDLFLAMARELQEREPGRNWRFHIFGDGPLAPELASLARSLGIADRTTFHGHRNDIIACIAALDTLVICSDHEGLPMTALESLVTGTPLVAHAVGGLSELLRGWADDNLVSRHAPEAYADTCLRMLRTPKSDYGRRCELGLANRSAQANSTKVLTLYREILDTVP